MRTRDLLRRHEHLESVLLSTDVRSCYELNFWIGATCMGRIDKKLMYYEPHTRAIK